MNEAVKYASTPTKQVSQTFTQVPKGQPKKWSVGKSATLDEMLRQTANTMTSDDARHIIGAGTVGKPNLATSRAAQMTMENTGPMPGIDITKLDFVNKAKKIYDASIQKDKSRGI